jgi:membrane fusion protein, epimerase transport system
MNAPANPEVFRDPGSAAIDDPTRTQNTGREERRLKIIGVVIVLVLIAVTGIWAVRAPLASAAIGSGVVTIENHRKAISHLEGGIVREVRVREGQQVSKGEVLLTLEDVQARAQLEQVRAQWIVSVAREARLIAQRDGLAKVVFPPSLMALAGDLRVGDAMRVQEQTFRARRLAQQGEMMLHERQITQLRQRGASLQEQRLIRERLLSSFEKERDDFEALANEGYIERQRVREMERSVVLNDGQRAALIKDIASNDAEIGAIQIKMLQLEKDLQREVTQELAQVQTDIFTLTERQRALEDTVKRITIVASEAGRVLALAVHSPGEVVRPGAHLLDIVPVQQNLIVEARLSPQDVDQLRVGQMAEVRFSAFRQRDMPMIQGQLMTLSADRLVEDVNGTKQSYYLAHIRVTDKGIADLARLNLELMPGMPADVLVTTGQRTLWHYLTAPLSDLMVRSLKEE